MSYREAAPAGALCSGVDRFWRLEAHRSDAQRVLPDGCLDIIVDLDAGRARVVGAMTKPLFTPASTTARSWLAVRFMPGAAARFLHVPAHELTDQSIELRALGRFDEVERARTVDELTTALLRRVDERSPRIEHAVRRLTAGTSTAALARELGWSRQHLRRTFQSHVGLNPKTFACVARMQRTLITLQTQPERGLADAAAALGYSDQAHLARELRLLAGVTATQVRRDAGSILPIPSLYGAAGSTS